MRQPFHNASVYNALFLILEAIVGLLIIILTAIYQSILTNYLEDIQSRLLSSYLVNVYIFGSQLLLTFLCSISLWDRLWRRRCTPNVRLMLSMWVFYCCVILASGFVTVWNLYYNIDVLEVSTENSLLRGIDEYYSCPEWKLLWDGLQMRKQCCGVHDYKDWMNADWMPRTRRNGSYCNKAVLAPVACFKRTPNHNHNHNQNRNLPNYLAYYSSTHDYSYRRPVCPSLTLDSINTKGCLPAFSHTIWRYFYILLLLALLALKFLICLCCLTKYIVQRQHASDGSDHLGLTDEEGYPLVVVKYPRNVHCIMFGEDDLASDIGPDQTCCNCADATDDGCEYCEG